MNCVQTCLSPKRITSPFQSGYNKFHSTESELCAFVMALSALWMKTVHILLDLYAAFDTSYFFSSISILTMRLLQGSYRLLCLCLPILVKSIFFSFRSSLTLSIQIFLCLPLLLLPSTC